MAWWMWFALGSLAGGAGTGLAVLLVLRLPRRIP